MIIVRHVKHAVLLLVVLCASCSSATSQTTNKGTLVDKVMVKQALTVGIERAEKSVPDAAHVLFYIDNNTDEDIRMLIWGTPFEQQLSADILSVTHNGQTLPYLGRMIKRGTPLEADYINVPAGMRLDSPLDLSKSYGVANAGEYSVALKVVEIAGVSMINQETPVTLGNSELSLLVVE